MKKWQSILLIILITFGTFIQSGMSVVNAVGENTSSSDVFSSKPTLVDSDSTIRYNFSKTLYSTLNNASSEVAYSIISLPKDKFLEPTEADLASSDTNLASSEILTATTTDYLIKYVYKDLGSNQNYNIPFIVRSMDQLKPGSVSTITQKSYNSSGVQLGESGSLDLKYISNMSPLSITGSVVKLDSSKVDSDSKLISDYSTKVSVSLDVSSYNDPHSFVVSIAIPEALTFDSENADSQWSYDSSTRTASFTNRPDTSGNHTLQKLDLPLIIPSGSTIPNEYNLVGNVGYENIAGSLFTSESAKISVMIKKPKIEMGYGSFTTYVKSLNGAFSKYDSINENTTKVDLKTNIYVASKYSDEAGQPLNPDTKIDSTVKEFTYTPMMEISTGRGSLLTDPITPIVVDHSVYTTVSFQSDAEISPDLATAISKNTAEVYYADGETETFPVGNAAHPFNSNKKPIKYIKVSFESPVRLTTEDGYKLHLQLDGNVAPQALSKIREANSTSFSFHNRLQVITDNVADPEYTSDEVDLVDSPYQSENFDTNLTKTYPEISANSKSGGGLILESGHTMLPGTPLKVSFRGTVKNANLLTNKNIKNGKVVFLLNKPGVTLSDKTTTLDSHLKNLEVIHNFKNSGKTAIVGDITDGEITADYSSWDYTIYLSDTSALDVGRVDIKAFFVFDNNLANFDYTNKEPSNGYYTPPTTVVPYDGLYGLYDNSDNPVGYIYDVSYFLFQPTSGFRVNKLISKKDSNIWVEDTNKLAQESGEEYSYKVKISNLNQAGSYQNIDAIDILPYAGDKMVSDSAVNRGSQFKLALSGPVENIPTGYTITYSTDSPKSGGLTSNLAATWVDQSAVSDWSKVTMIRVKADSGITLDSQQNISLQYNVKTPENINYDDNLMAGNSIAVRSENTTSRSVTDVESNVAILRTEGANPTETGSVQIKKIDANNHSIGLANAEFKLTSTDGKEYTGVTDSTGTFTVADLPVGSYAVVETKAPTGYELDSTTKNIEITKDKQTVITVENTKTTVVTPANGSIKIIKIDAGDHSVTLANAEFKLTDAAGKEYVGKTDIFGNLTFANLPVGLYELEETKAPNGYDLDTKAKNVAVTKENQTIVTVTNVKSSIVPVEKGSIQVKKVDAGDHAVTLANAEFKLTATDSDKTYTGRTNSAGILIFKDLPIGSYELIETKAPNGYDLNTTVRNIAITKTGLVKEVTVENQKQQPVTPEIPEELGSLKIDKVDSLDSSKHLANAEFKLTANDGKNYFGKTDLFGILNFINLPTGSYDLVETKAPTGYDLDLSVRKIYITKTDLNQKILVTNKKQSPEISKPDIPEKNKPDKDKPAKTPNEVKLPQTNEVYEKGLLVIGVLLILLALGFLIFKFKKNAKK